VIKICSKCGALLKEEAEGCPFCEIPVETENSESLVPVIAGSARREDVAEPEWRQEVGRRLAQYRARRHRTNPEDSATPAPQPALPFRTVRTHEIEIEERPRPRSIQRPRAAAERVEICIQPELDFSSAPGERARPQTALVPVAPLSARREAGILDAVFIGLTCAAFVGLFHSLGGQIAMDRIDALVCAAVLYLFYALYFLVFTVFAGATPGMQLRGLSTVRLDGSLPDTGQLLWRGFGYLLSGFTLMLGFLWSLWDEDGFTWHDRISQTYVTASAPLAAADPIEIRPAARRAR